MYARQIRTGARIGGVPVLSKGTAVQAGRTVLVFRMHDGSTITRLPDAWLDAAPVRIPAAAAVRAPSRVELVAAVRERQQPRHEESFALVTTRRV